jgi:hypothetical protein
MPRETEQKTKKMKGETSKLYRAILVVYKMMIIPMVRWSLLRAAFRLAPRHPLAALIMAPAEVLDQIVLPELPLEEFVFPDVHEVAMTRGRSGRGQAPIPGPTEFAVSVKA